MNTCNETKARRCRVTGATLPAWSGKGRPAEYANEDARQLAFILGRLPGLIRKLAPMMDAEHVGQLKRELWGLANNCNARMNRLRAGTAEGGQP